MWHVVCQLSLGADDTHTHTKVNWQRKEEKYKTSLCGACVVRCSVDCVFGVKKENEKKKTNSASARLAWDDQPALDWLWTGLTKAEVSDYRLLFFYCKITDLKGQSLRF